jgi:hypothetical protein
MTTVPIRLNSQPKDRARRVAAWLTCFPADLPFSSSHASHRVVIQIRSAQSVPMRFLSDRMNRAPPAAGQAYLRAQPVDGDEQRPHRSPGGPAAVEPGDVAQRGELLTRFPQFQGQLGEGLAEDRGGGLLGGQVLSGLGEGLGELGVLAGQVLERLRS